MTVAKFQSRFEVPFLWPTSRFDSKVAFNLIFFGGLESKWLYRMAQISPWRDILYAPSSRQAIQNASLHFSDLNRAPLPVEVTHLSKRAYENVIAVRRAFGVSVDGVIATGWEDWSDSEELKETNETYSGRNVSTKSASQPKKLKIISNATPRDSEARIISIPKDSATVTKSQEDAKQGFNRSSENIKAELSASNNVQQSDKIEGHPTPEDIRSASVLKTWAQTSSHTPPPQQALMHVAQSKNLSALLSTLIDVNSSQPLRATILSALTDSVPTSAADLIQTMIILPYLSNLETPASREMLAAIVQFYTRHWRPSLSLYQYFSSSDRQVNNAVAEVLTRVCAVLTDEAALESLRAFCNASWSECTIPLAQGLITRCKTSNEIGGFVVPALGRNVPQLEKSVRFGKLLFTIVKDIPDIRINHKQTMETVCGRCKVFLAKRALTILRQYSSAS